MYPHIVAIYTTQLSQRRHISIHISDLVSARSLFSSSALYCQPCLYLHNIAQRLRWCTYGVHIFAAVCAYILEAATLFPLHFVVRWGALKFVSRRFKVSLLWAVALNICNPRLHCAIASTMQLRDCKNKIAYTHAYNRRYTYLQNAPDTNKNCQTETTNKMIISKFSYHLRC